MNAQLKRFMFLSYALHLMEEELNIDDEGLTIEQFEEIDIQFEKFLGSMDAAELKAELVELVHIIAPQEEGGN